MLMGVMLMGVILLTACGGGDSGPPMDPAVVPVTTGLTKVSAASSPYTAGCDGNATPGTSYLNAEVEPSVAINPANAQNLFGTWQQDRWSNGGAHGLAGAVSFDGGATWSPRFTTFSRCSGGSFGNAGDYERSTDPWVSFSPDGTAYWMALSFSDTSPSSTNAMRVARSTDGGNSWATPITLLLDGPAFFNDKNSLTADPLDSHYVYAVWDRLDSVANTGPTYFSRTTDGGASWEAARAIRDPGVALQTIGNLIVVLPDGTLVNVFAQLDQNSGAAEIDVIRSTDHGLNWSAPVFVADLLSRGVIDPENGNVIRDGGILPSIAVAPDGKLYLAWQDARFSSGARDGIALSSSTDGGLTWSTPVQVNGAPAVQAFTPTVAVDAGGFVGVSYFDFRENGAGDNTLPTAAWLAVSADGTQWSERRTGLFDEDLAPSAGGLFLGDYMGLLGIGSNFRMFYVQANATTANRTDVYTVLLPSVAPPSSAKSATRGYRATPAEPYVMSREWRALNAERVHRERHHFANRATPIQAADD